MKKIALFYSYNTKNTSKAAKLIQETFDSQQIEKHNVEETNEEEFNAYENFILGVPTWFDGELPNYWDEFLPALEELDLSGKTFALYGAGNQKEYSENFVDALGLMAESIESLGGKLIGFVPNEGYSFEHSKALRGDHFVGLPLDFEVQPKLVKPRIEKWVEQLKKEF
ncbi:MAG: flavodoxin [Bacteroidales bacterium]|nr:flavodoxin [Bacteroidales bacterium]